MSINNRHGNLIKLNHLYVDYNEVRETLQRPFPMNYTNGLCIVTELDKDYINLKYEISGSSVGNRGHSSHNIGKRLIPLDSEEVKDLIKDRKRRLSFLEQAAQSQPSCTENTKHPFPGSPFEQ